MKQYLDLVKNILDNGIPKQPTRMENGKPVNVENGTIGLPCQTFIHDMREGFPALTTRKIAFKSTMIELEGFIKGITNKSWYEERGCKFWSYWSNTSQFPYRVEECPSESVYRSLYNEYQLKNRDLGPLGYSHGWRNFGGHYRPIPQIWTLKDKIINISISDDELVGTIHNGQYGTYTVVKYDGKDKYYNKRYSVKFHNTGFTKANVNKKQVLDENIRDPYFPYICDVAATGEYSWIPLEKTVIIKLLNQWRQMIQRCYNTKNSSYSNYGGNGIYVSNRWLVFEYFLQDIQEISGWENKLENWGSYDLDKDILDKGYYGKDSCLWVTKSDNANNTKQNYFFDAYAPDGTEYKNILGINRFCKKYKLKTKNVEASIINNTLTHNGWKFIRKENLKNKDHGYDQLKSIVDKLKTNPYDRRMVCSAWNPNQMDMMALPPCHFAWNVMVYGNTISLAWHQRSADLALGVPANIASYATLLLLLAKEANLEPWLLKGDLNDCHLYENQLDEMRQLVSRTPKKLPSANILNFNNIFDWTHKDIELIGWNPDKQIKIGLTV